LFVTNPVTWLLPDGSTIEAPGAQAQAPAETPPAEEQSEEPAKPEASSEQPPAGAQPPNPPRAEAPKAAPERVPPAAVSAYLPPTAAEPGLWWRTTQVTISDVGYHDGFFLEDTEGGR